MNYPFSIRIWALLFLSAGYGWAGGHFIPGDAPVWAYVFQFAMLLILFILAAGFVKEAGFVKAAADLTKTPSRIRRNVVGLNIYAGLTLLVNIANLVRGVIQNGRYGSHNRFADLVPILLIITGDVLWLATNIRRSEEKIRPMP